MYARKLMVIGRTLYTCKLFEWVPHIKMNLQSCDVIHDSSPPSCSRLLNNFATFSVWNIRKTSYTSGLGCILDVHMFTRSFLWIPLTKLHKQSFDRLEFCSSYAKASCKVFIHNAKQSFVYQSCTSSVLSTERIFLSNWAMIQLFPILLTCFIHYCFNFLKAFFGYKNQKTKNMWRSNYFSSEFHFTLMGLSAATLLFNIQIFIKFQLDLGLSLLSLRLGWHFCFSFEF